MTSNFSHFRISDSRRKERDRIKDVRMRSALRVGCISSSSALMGKLLRPISDQACTRVRSPYITSWAQCTFNLIQFNSRRNYPQSSASAFDIMRKWNLKFSGNRNEDPETFLMKNIEGRTIVPVEDFIILKIIPLFLSGIALHWYRSFRHTWKNFHEFSSSFRSRFGDVDFQFELRQEMYKCTQDENEPVADYLTCMMALFDRVIPNFSESEEVSFAHRNLLPRLQLLIPRQNAKLFRPPPVPERSLLPDLAYKDNKPRNRDRQRELISLLEESNFDNINPTENIIDKFFLAKESTPFLQNSQLSQKNNTNKTSNISRNNNPKDSNHKNFNSNNPSRNPFLPNLDSQNKSPDYSSEEIICWNCDKKGHRLDDCSEPQKSVLLQMWKERFYSSYLSEVFVKLGKELFKGSKIS